MTTPISASTRYSRPLVALAAATVLLLTGCQSGPEPTIDPSPAPSASSSPTAAASEAPVESPALVENRKRKNGSYDTGARETLGGIVSWEVLDGVKLDLGTRLGKKADAFLADHYLREDRWLGSHVIKAGEMDALAEKVSPDFYDQIEKSVLFFDRVREQTGGDDDKMTAKQKKQVPAHARTIGHFILNGSTVEGGKGEIRNEITRKVVWIQTGGDYKGLINTWVSIKTRRMNNTGKGKEIALYEAWKQVKGEWTIVDSGWKDL